MGSSGVVVIDELPTVIIIQGDLLQPAVQGDTAVSRQRKYIWNSIRVQAGNSDGLYQGRR